MQIKNINKLDSQGFTLIELLAVIIILAIIALIATPIILEVIEESKLSANRSQAQLLLSSAETFYAQTILTEELQDKFNGTDNLYSLITTTNKKPEFGSLKINSEGVVYFSVYIDGICYKKGESDDKLLEIADLSPENCVTDSNNNHLYQEDLLGKSTPVLTEGLLPVIISNEGTISIVDGTEQWYSYENKKWANAIVLTESSTKTIGEEITIEEYSDNIAMMFVWIPRFSYKMFDTDTVNDTNDNKEIEINFSEITSNEEDLIVHPAFSYTENGNIIEINGFWTGKFELTGNLSQPTILPNEIIQSDLSISEFYFSVLEIDNIYNLNTTESHIMKNNEWGAAAYLSSSIYGMNSEVFINNTNITGCGANTANADKSEECLNMYGTQTVYNQSTTGNINGIFDMSGGTYEYTMGVTENEGQLILSNSKFETDNYPQLKYYISYPYGTSNTDYSRGKYGDATRETTSWYGDAANFPNSNNSWFLRGGNNSSKDYAGLFAFGNSDGSAHELRGTRVSLWIK